MTQDVSTELVDYEADDVLIKGVITTLLASYPKRVGEEATSQYVYALRCACRGAPASVLKAMLDPITGLVGQCPFLPTAAEIRKFIVGKAIEADRLRRLARENRPRIEKEFRLTDEERAARIAKLTQLRGTMVEYSVKDRAERMANMFKRRRA
jgi:hypothetical protein